MESLVSDNDDDEEDPIYNEDNLENAKFTKDMEDPVYDNDEIMEDSVYDEDNLENTEFQEDMEDFSYDEDDIDEVMIVEPSHSQIRSNGCMLHIIGPTLAVRS